MARIYSLLIIWMLLGCTPSRKEEQSADDLSRIQLTDLDGKVVSLSEMKGKVVFLNFWATWCRPCLQEMPGIMRLRDQLSDEEVVFYFASDEDKSRIKDFIEARKFNGNFLRIENPEEVGIQALPTTFIYDKSGNKVYSEIGYKNWDEPSARELVTKHLNNEE
jgi:thiol-disulfide isomerase/thioredoxin